MITLIPNRYAEELKKYEYEFISGYGKTCEIECLSPQGLINDIDYNSNFVIEGIIINEKND